MINNKIKKYLVYFLFITIFILLLSYLLLYYEKGQVDTKIHDIGDSLWYFFVTLTSVGYGDIVPVSRGGFIIGYVYIIASLIVIGILVGSISSNIYKLMEEKKMGFNGTKFENHIVFSLRF